MWRIIDTMQEFIDRQTGVRSIMCEIAADTAADLPANTADRVFILGTFATAIDTGDIYKINSAGAWILQPSQNAFSNVYTKSEIEGMIIPYTNAAIETGLLLDGTTKNKLQLTGSNVTGYGIKCTFDHVAGTIHLDGINADKKCTGSFNIQAAQSINAPFVAGTVYRFVCGGYETSNDTIGLYVYTSGATPISQFDCYQNNVAEWNDAWKQNSGFRLFIRSGTVVDNVTLQPMICTEFDYQISAGIVPYTPTPHELYALIKSYHP